MGMTKFDNVEDAGFIAITSEIKRWTKTLIPATLTPSPPPAQSRGQNLLTDPVTYSMQSNNKTEGISLLSGASRTYLSSLDGGFITAGWTILHAAARRGSLSDVDAALSAGVDPNVRTPEEGYTPLYVAACFGFLEISRLLLRNGAKINARTTGGSTALREASIGGATEVVKLLLNHGADTEFGTEGNNDTPLLTAAARSHLPVVIVLLEAGANINAQQNRGWSALYYSLLEKNEEMAALVLEYSPNIELSTISGVRPLQLAAMNGLNKTLRGLLDKGAEVDGKDNNGLTALRVTVQGGHLEAVQILVKRGADINVKEFNGQHSPVDIALILGHTQIYLWLMQQQDRQN
jgi:ankyrin repeat protein